MHHFVRVLETGRVTTARRGALPKLDPLVRSASPSGPGSEERMFRYRLHSPGGDDLGEATYAQ